MCNGCMLNAIRKGGTYLRTKDISEVEKSKMKLSSSAGLPDLLVDDNVRKYLYDPIEKQHRKNILNENNIKECDIPNLFADVRACITILVLLNTIGVNITCKHYKDYLALEVMENIMNEFKDIKFNEEHAYIWFYLNTNDDRSYLNLENLPYAIIYQMSNIFIDRQVCPEQIDTLDEFFSRPFIKYYVEKDPENYFVRRIVERWNRLFPKLN